MTFLCQFPYLKTKVPASYLTKVFKALGTQAREMAQQLSALPEDPGLGHSNHAVLQFPQLHGPLLAPTGTACIWSHKYKQNTLVHSKHSPSYSFTIN